MPPNAMLLSSIYNHIPSKKRNDFSKKESCWVKPNLDWLESQNFRSMKVLSFLNHGEIL